MALTVITEDPAVRELGDLIIVGEWLSVESSSVDERPDDDGNSETSEPSSDAGQGDRDNEDEEKEDDEADGEEEDDDTESERS